MMGELLVMNRFITQKEPFRWYYNLEEWKSSSNVYKNKYKYGKYVNIEAINILQPTQ